MKTESTPEKSQAHPPRTERRATRNLIGLLALLALAATVPVHAQVPNLLNYQGRVAVGGVNFTGSGQFKFALVNANGATSYWKNSADTAPADGVPDSAVALTVTNGLYSVLLGDTSLPNMLAIPSSVWTNADVRLRVWFNDGANGNQLLTPDQRIAPNGYLPAGGVSSVALDDGAITNAKIASGAVDGTKLSSNLTLNGTNTSLNGNTFRARGGSPGAFGGNFNGYSFTGNGGDDDSGMFSSSDGQVEFFTNAGERLRIDGAGNVGVGTTSPNVAVEIARYNPAGPTLRLTGVGNFGAKVGIDLATYDPVSVGGGSAPSARIEASDNDYSASISFLTKTPGAFANPLVPRLVISNAGVVSTPGGFIIETRPDDNVPAETGRIWLNTNVP